MKKFISMLLLALILLFQAPSPAKADVYGGRWDTNIKFYVNTSDSDIIGSFSVARDQWNTVLSNIGANVRISKVYSSSEANVIISTQSYIGAVATTTLQPGKYVASYSGALVKVNPEQYKYLSSTEKLNVAVHEMGHVLGLADNSKDTGSVMNSSVTYTVVPTSYDKSELDKIY